MIPLLYALGVWQGKIQFSRVITNLLNNAMKHNESGTHIKIGMYRKNGYIYILVADSGRRIPGELAEHLFEPFTKGDVSRKSGSGSGLGLSIAKKIIEMFLPCAENGCPEFVCFN